MFLVETNVLATSESWDKSCINLSQFWTVVKEIALQVTSSIRLDKASATQFSLPGRKGYQRQKEQKQAKTDKKRKRQVIKRRHKERYQSRISPTQGKSQNKSKEVKVKKVKSIKTQLKSKDQ
ncbi:hypothetical protein Tco_1425337 [Tanacetum coccineum]